jgi:phosphotransferase system IIA component
MDDSKHAIGLKLGNGMEILIHIGLDTVNMKGDGFSYFVNTGDSVKAGDKLISFSKKAIADAGHPDCIVMAISENADDLPITFVTGNDAVTGETVIANIG